MNDFQQSVGGPTNKEVKELPEGDHTSTSFTAFQNLDQGPTCSAELISDADMNPTGARFLFSANHSSQETSNVQDIAENCMEISDDSVPCSQSVLTISIPSPVAALVPITNNDLPVQLLQEQALSPTSGFLLNKEEVDHNDGIPDQFINYNSEEERSDDCSFTLNQENVCTVAIDDDSCDASFMQTMSDSACAFNEQYRVKRDVGKTSPNVPLETFSPDAFLSSIPMFCKTSQKRPATILPKLNTTDPSCYGQYENGDQCYSSPTAGVVLPSKKLYSALYMPGKSQGVPIAPKPHPNEKVSCCVLVVPAPLYYENFAPLESVQMQPEQHAEDMLVTESTMTPEGGTPLRGTEFEHHSMQWNTYPPNPARTPLPSTVLRVSPSPHEGSKSSPIITVSTTSTPIQPLQGRKQQYVIAQGNNRHLQGLSFYKDSLATPTGEENHQPIYLQGLPPQGFRRLLKSKEGSVLERTTKRSLAPLFSEVSTSSCREASVPQMEKSPLTCIKIKVPREIKVPHSVRTNQDSSLRMTADPDTPFAFSEEVDLQRTVSALTECRDNKGEPSLDSSVTERVEIITTPTTMGRRGEDKEKKKIRDRRYDAELKKAFQHLRQLVPRVQRNSTRGQILQEAVKYIGILEKKVLDAGLWSTLQSIEAQRNAQVQGVTEETSTAKEDHGILMDNLLSSVSHDDPDICSNLVAGTLTEEECYENSQEETATLLTSPLILISSMSQPTGKGACSFVSPEEAVLSIDSVDTNEKGITGAEFPLSVPLQQIHFLTADQSDETSALVFQSPEQLSSQEPHTRLIPEVEVPSFTDESVFPGKSHEVRTSPQHDSFLSAVTTISPEGLSDLGVALSPLLSPLGILFSPGGDRRQEPAIAFLLESTEDTDADFAISSSSIDPTSSDELSSICSDMTSIAASVEVTTAQMGKSTLRSRKIRKSPRSSSIQIVPSISPKLANQSKRSSPRYHDRRVLQNQSNFEEANSPLISSGRGRQRKLNNRSPELAFFDHTDENLCFAMDRSRTPPSRVSGVLLTGKKKASSTRGGGGAKRGRRI